MGNDYGWYQGQFMKLAESLYARHKLKVLDAFIENYKPEEKKTDATELLRAIDQKVFDKWLDEMM